MYANQPSSIEVAEAAYREASSAYRQEWARGNSPALAAATARKDAAWANLCEISRATEFRYEDGAFEAYAQMQQLSLDDA